MAANSNTKKMVEVEEVEKALTFEWLKSWGNLLIPLYTDNACSLCPVSSLMPDRDNNARALQEAKKLGFCSKDFTPFGRFVFYKVQKCQWDRDKSTDAAALFALLWKNTLGIEHLELENGGWVLRTDHGYRFSGDTMTSAQATVNIILGESPSFAEYKHEHKKQHPSKTLLLKLYCNNREKVFKEMHDEYPELSDWLLSIHSLGNMIPVPDGFNTSRSGPYASFDYWDLALMQIYLWYQDNPSPRPMLCNSSLSDLFSGDPMGNTVKWLSLFGSWNGFVEANYLQDCVETKTAFSYGKPYLFWEGHSLDRPTPTTKLQFGKLFENSRNMINQRENRLKQAIIDLFFS